MGRVCVMQCRDALVFAQTKSYYDPGTRADHAVGLCMYPGANAIDPLTLCINNIIYINIFI